VKQKVLTAIGVVLLITGIGLGIIVIVGLLVGR
jgi:hypothetical protein